MHDFQPVSVLERGCGPAVTRYDVAIQLDSHPLGLHCELIYEGRKRKAIAKITFFAIDDQLQAETLSVSHVSAGEFMVVIRY